MTRHIVPGRAQLDFYKPDNEPADPARPDAGRTPDIQIGPPTDSHPGDSAEHIKKAKVPHSLGALKDQASFAVDNRGGRYRRGDREITSGDEVVFSVQFATLDSEAGAAGYGGNYGANYGGRGGWQERFRGIVRSPKVSGDGAGASTLSFKAEDIVGTVLGWRYLEAGYQDMRVAGTPTSVLERALSEKCPEIAHDRITSARDDHTTQTFNATKMLKVAKGLTNLIDCVTRSDARSLVVTPLDSITASWELSAADFGTFDFEIDDGELANALRIDGASGQAAQDRQESQTGWANVTSDSRLTHQLDVPKSEVSSIEIWTDPRRTDSGDNIRVRLQKDDGGAPIDPSDSSLDHAQRSNNGILEHNGWTTFPMPDNDVLEADPWLIIEATQDGDGGGQDIGVNNAGTPAYRAYYPYPLSGRKEDPGSIAEFRRRELQHSDSSLTSLDALGQELDVQLGKENTLSEEYSFDARSVRAHLLSPGDAIWIDEPTAGAAGNYVVTKRTDTYGGASMTTDITTTDIESL